MESGSGHRGAQIVHLSGRQRGQTRRLHGTTHLVAEGGGRLRLAPAGEIAGDAAYAASIVPDEEGWRLEVDGDVPVWVNGMRSGHRRLHDGDLIEIQEIGLLRFRPRGDSPYKSLREALGDCLDCARLGGRNALDRAGVLALGAPMEIATQVAPPVRVAAALTLVVLVGSVAGLWMRAARLERVLVGRLARLEGIAELRAGSEEESFSAADFESARAELDFRIEDTLARIEALEHRSGARGRVIEGASRAVVFVQGAYGFVEPGSGKPLRLDRSGAATLDADGEPLELRYTGTGFVLAERHLVVTNRHVALPWEFDAQARRLVGRGLTPVMHRLVGFLPRGQEPFDLAVIRAHAVADVALLRPATLPAEAEGLRLADEAAQIGAEVIVLGYPTGMRALLARADPAFVATTLGSDPVGFWELARRLARGGYVTPLATVGSIGQSTPGAVVYDAETTHGGSGGPVLTLDGAVIAVNAAILPEFGGSNLGVPAARVRELLPDPEAGR